MSPFKHYINGEDPSLFMGLIKKLSFNAGQMNALTGGVTRLRGKTKDGEVVLTRVGDVDHVKIYPSPSPSAGGWEFSFVYPDTLADGGYLTLHLELKKESSQYYCDIVISSAESKTFPIYIYPGLAVPTTMYIQTSNVVFTSTLISFQLSIWENHGTLGVAQTQSPSAVKGMTWIGNYTHSATYLSADNYPLDGYIVPKTYANWTLFVAGAWAETAGKYSVNVTMVNVSNLQNSISLTYMNNNDGSIAYSPSGETTTSTAPLTSIKDDYAYSGNIRPYVNKFVGWASAYNSNNPDTLTENYMYYETTDPPSYYNWQNTWGGSYWPWPQFHPGLFKEDGAYSEPVQPYYYDWTSNGHTTPHEYEQYKSINIYSNDNLFTNTLSISNNPTEFISYDDAISPDMGKMWSLWRRNITSGIVWQYNSGASWTPIQLPAQNAKKLSSTYTTATAIAYSAGTDGSGGD